jgi:hypothetical protein
MLPKLFSARQNFFSLPKLFVSCQYFYKKKKNRLKSRQNCQNFFQLFPACQNQKLFSACQNFFNVAKT